VALERDPETEEIERTEEDTAESNGNKLFQIERLEK
jgi:hypothetical protein